MAFLSTRFPTIDVRVHDKICLEEFDVKKTAHHFILSYVGTTRKKTKKHSNEHILKRAHNASHVYSSHSLPLDLCYRWDLWRRFSQKTIIIIHPMHLNSCLASAPSSRNQQLIMYDWWKKWSGTAQVAFKNKRASHTHTRIHRRETCVRDTMRGFSIYISGCIQRRSLTHAHTFAETKRC